MRGFYWSAEELLDAEEGLCSLEWFGLDLVGWFVAGFRGFYHYKVLTKNHSVGLCLGEVCSLWRQTGGFFISCYGRAVAQVVNGWPVITEARFLSQFSQWKICDGQIGTGRGFSHTSHSTSGHLHLRVALPRTEGRYLGIFRRTMIFRKLGKTG